jgi:fumarate hydratase subunit beta
MKKLTTPLSKEAVLDLKIGDEVLISGTIVTARDAAHKLMVERKPGFLRPHLEGGIIYHCGPIVKKEGGGWKIVSAGPTTSIREEPYEATVLREYGVRGVIGKGGMGQGTLDACRELGAVYLHAVGGAAVYLSKFIKRVREVLLLEELGTPEAFWILEVEDFPAVVTMDSQGNSLHKTVQQASDARLKELLSKKIVNAG